MKILFLTLAEIDDRSFGGAMRGNDIRNALVQVGEVDTLVIHGAGRFALATEWDAHRVKRATFTAHGVSLEALAQRRRIRAWVAGIVEAGAYDVIVARYLGLAMFVQFRHWQRLILDADDILKKPSPGHRTSFRAKLKLGVRNAIARRAIGQARHVWIVNPADMNLLADRQRVSLLGNAIRLPLRSRERSAVVPARILMVGYFEHPPNAQGLRWFADEVLPAVQQKLPSATLRAVGKHPAELARELGDRVEFRGFVDDLVREYDEAALVIAPIHFGGGTQLKVIDALAHGRPLVTSKFSHEGFSAELRDGQELLVANDQAQWIAHCLRVLDDPEAAAAMSERGCSVVHARHGSEAMAATVQRTLTRVFSGT